MFSRNRSAQLLELPLLSRFAADLRRHTRAFAYKPPHKIHNTSPRRAITTEDIHRSREFRQNRGGDSPADRRISKQNPSSSHRLAPFPSLASVEHREAFALVPEIAPPLPSALHTDSPLPRALNKKQAKLHPNKRRRSFPLASSATRPPMWVGRRTMLRPISPSSQRRRGCQNGKRRMRPPKFDEKKGEGG